MSRAEEITSEVRRLVITCRALEAQLKESIPKKVHNETVAKMQAEIDRLKSELNSVKQELERTRSIGSYLSSIENEVKSQYDFLRTFAARIQEGTVSNEVYQQSLQKVRELESKIQALTSSTVPKEAYQELENRLRSMVTREELERAEARIRELETAISNSVPKETLEELKARITELVSEALANIAKEAAAAAQNYNTKNDEAGGEVDKVVAPVEAIDSESAQSSGDYTAPLPEDYELNSVTVQSVSQDTQTDQTLT